MGEMFASQPLRCHTADDMNSVQNLVRSSDWPINKKGHKDQNVVLLPLIHGGAQNLMITDQKKHKF